MYCGRNIWQTLDSTKRKPNSKWIMIEWFQLQIENKSHSRFRMARIRFSLCSFSCQGSLAIHRLIECIAVYHRISLIFIVMQCIIFISGVGRYCIRRWCICLFCFGRLLSLVRAVVLVAGCSIGWQLKSMQRLYFTGIIGSH